jgi:hypothetical protein
MIATANNAAPTSSIVEGFMTGAARPLPTRLNA